jgi:hypothetical protein
MNEQPCDRCPAPGFNQAVRICPAHRLLQWEQEELDRWGLPDEWDRSQSLAALRGTTLWEMTRLHFEFLELRLVLVEELIDRPARAIGRLVRKLSRGRYPHG